MVNALNYRQRELVRKDRRGSQIFVPPMIFGNAWLPGPRRADEARDDPSDNQRAEWKRTPRD
jgi:hypothetical protein